MNPTLRNALRWTGALLAAFLWGLITAMTDGSPKWQDLLRHGLLAAVPTILALKITLEKQLGINGSDNQKGFITFSHLCLILLMIAIGVGLAWYPSFEKRINAAYHARQVHTTLK